ncbi:MAG: hypothetical protein IPK90_08040 [Chitinophagaceae bacterium]|nr:hypothetical protein [Chitinophagaceae bacterium]
MSTTNETTVKTATNKELAAMYGVSTKTFRTWLMPHLNAVGERKKPLLYGPANPHHFRTPGRTIAVQKNRHPSYRVTVFNSSRSTTVLVVRSWKYSGYPDCSKNK